MTPWRTRYKQAYERHHEVNYPSAFKDFGSPAVIYPDVRTANGLTRMIINFINWSGFRATRIQSQGQHVIEKYKGRVVSHGFRPGTTRKGTADVSATINGMSVMIEIKVGSDRPRPEQLREQALERAAGGVYEFVSNPDEFFEVYDKIILP